MEFLCFVFVFVFVFFFWGGGDTSLKTHLGESFPALARQVRRTAEFAGKLLRFKGSRKQQDRSWPPIGHKKTITDKHSNESWNRFVKSSIPGAPSPVLKRISRPFLLTQLTAPGHPGVIRIMIFLTNYKIIYICRSSTDHLRVFTIW